MSLGVLCYGDKILEGEIEYGKLGLFSPQPIRLFLLMDPSFPLLNTSICPREAVLTNTSPRP